MRTRLSVRYSREAWKYRCVCDFKAFAPVRSRHGVEGQRVVACRWRTPLRVATRPDPDILLASPISHLCFLLITRSRSSPHIYAPLGAQCASKTSE